MSDKLLVELAIQEYLDANHPTYEFDGLVIRNRSSEVYSHLWTSGHGRVIWLKFPANLDFKAIIVEIELKIQSFEKLNATLESLDGALTRLEAQSPPQ